MITNNLLITVDIGAAISFRPTLVYLSYDTLPKSVTIEGRPGFNPLSGSEAIGKEKCLVLVAENSTRRVDISSHRL
jgi:hypothetical protein